MDELIAQIRIKRHKLNWTTKKLAEKTNIPHSAILRIENGTGKWPDHIFSVNKALEDAIKGSEIENQRRSIINDKLKSLQKKRVTLNWSIEDLSEKTLIPVDILDRVEKGIGHWDSYIQRIETVLNRALKLPHQKWSIKYDYCIKCGSTETKHVSRGLCKNCYDRDIEARHKDVNRSRNYGGSSSLLTREYLLENYIKNEKSLGDIAKEANCSRQYVHKLIVSYGIPSRNKSDARDIALSKSKLKFVLRNDKRDDYSVTLRKINVNETFFSSWSAKMAYVLGIIFTDGNLNPGRIREPWRAKSASTIPSINLAQKERELLDKVLFLMKCDAKVSFRKEHNYNGIVAGALYYTKVTNVMIYDDLVKLGLTPSKSLNMKFPEVPQEYARHFIRGCWDGDGTVYIEKRLQRVIAGYVSGSLQFVKGLVETLVQAGLPDINIFTTRKETPSYYIRYTGSRVPQLFHYLYDDVSSEQYLERKYNLFKKSLDMNPLISGKSIKQIDLNI
jgi:ribosome-binding protein aMBF1 (putative translation factor)